MRSGQAWDPWVRDYPVSWLAWGSYNSNTDARVNCDFVNGVRALIRLISWKNLGTEAYFLKTSTYGSLPEHTIVLWWVRCIWFQWLGQLGTMRDTKQRVNFQLVARSHSNGLVAAWGGARSVRKPFHARSRTPPSVPQPGCLKIPSQIGLLGHSRDAISLGSALPGEKSSDFDQSRRSGEKYIS